MGAELLAVSYCYPGTDRPVLRDASCTIEDGDFIVVVGPQASGKSTLLRLLNGLIPHFHGGRLGGRVLVDGLDTSRTPPRELARVAGMVFQDPEVQAVTDVVEDEIAFGLENEGLPLSLMRKRVEEALDQLGLAHLRQRAISTLSGGERQRVAIASVLAMQPRILLLDEATSQLDPQSADDVIAAVQRLNSDLGMTVLGAEHRLERVLQYAGRVLHTPGDGSVAELDTRTAARLLDGAPPVARLARLAGWSPTPLTVAEARRFTRDLTVYAPVRAPAEPGGPVILTVDRATLFYGDAPALQDVSLEVREGEVVALMGRNGSGKTSLLRAIVGLERLQGGRIGVLERDPGRDRVEDITDFAGLVPQDPQAVLFRETVEDELRFSLRARRRPDAVEMALEEWDLGALRGRDPRDVSVGQRQHIAIAVMLAHNPRLWLLDEPTRGMDAASKRWLAAKLRARAQTGGAVVLVTHDVELAAEVADRVVLLAGGRSVVDGPARDVLSESVLFSTQVNRLLGHGLLTVEEGADALGIRRP
jgi:energy-coupling factor transport system ATP-binding protein